MAFSVNTNAGAMAALQSLSATNRGMETTQSRINSGLSVGSTKDDSAKFTVAQTLRGDLGDLQAVTSSLNNAKSVTDVAVAGAEQISDLVNQMHSKAIEASDAVDQASRDAIAKDLTALKAQVNSIISSSSFNGTNLLKAGGGTVSALQSITDTSAATGQLQFANQGLDTAFAAGSVGAAGAAITLGNAAAAETLATDLDTFVTGAAGLKTTLSTLGSASRQIDGQLSFNSKLSDVVSSGIGNLVDADLAKESANLQALQVRQQLGVQALSIANQAPQAILSLFR